MITAVATTTDATGAQILGIGVIAIVSLIALSILRDVSMVELENRKINNNGYTSLSLFVNSSKAFIIPLIYVFLSIILYRIVLVAGV